MKTFDYEQVRAVLTPLRAKFDDCAHGEGNECETLDNQLDCCAAICFEVASAVRKWARDVFSGEVVFDPDAEAAWRAEVKQIYTQAVRLWHRGSKAEMPCWELPAQNKLAAELWQLHQLLDNWVSPQRSVGPSARVRPKFSEPEREAIRKQLEALPPFTPRAKKKHGGDGRGLGPATREGDILPP